MESSYISIWTDEALKKQAVFIEYLNQRRTEREIQNLPDF